MRLKIMNLKYSIKPVFFGISLMFASTAFAQEVVVTDSTAIQPDAEIKVKSEEKQGTQRRKVDGIAAVIGDYIILESDIDLMYKDMQSQGISTADVSDCNLAGSLMENKLYAHHAVQDSIIIPDAQINGMIDQQIQGFVSQAGSMDKLLEFYNKENEAELREELFRINKQRQLAQRMQQKIIEEIQITPEEVRQYFDKMEEKPMFGTEVELSQIVIEPEIPESEKQKVIDRLNEFKADILDNGASFSTKAVLYSQDPGTASGGGKITLTRKDPFVKEFKDVAFSLQEGEVSDPFETEFGYHIIQVNDIRGQTVDLRHILLIPDVTNASVEKARTEIDTLRKKIVAGELDFAAAAREASDEKETRNEGGKLINPRTGDTRFELTKIDPKLFKQVEGLKEGEVSLVLTQQDRTGRPQFKIMKVTKKISEHKADYATDYQKIKELALRDKQLKEIEKWQKEKIADTYIKVNGKYRECDYTSDWVKN
ncbi:peptidylprolyl isomerase [Christiangramia salexigens]|uniref:Peptidylprolyl isomerase n=1 Tax=Christiangramia salexigens TaxID=1913577 RepID=A0A1L3J1D8_9FLAO|nr:peptidylprolyl isomerase [Christiangramia salexigens]APG58927.1 peptidylprolyl isomerase [Christiangramia salexigens]